MQSRSQIVQVLSIGILLAPSPYCSDHHRADDTKNRKSCDKHKTIAKEQDYERARNHDE
jgi:hypothetical protein